MKDLTNKIAAKRPFKAAKWYLAGVLTVLILLPSMTLLASSVGILSDIFSDFNIRVNGVELVLNWDEQTRTLSLDTPEGAAVLPGAPLGPGVYLESDIFGTIQSPGRLRAYPANGSFTMRDQTFFRGVNAGSAAWSEGYVTYFISGRNFTRLTGIIGRCASRPTMTQNVTIAISGDGRLLAGFELTATCPNQEIDVVIPPGTNEIVIRMTRPMGFGDAAFR